MDDSVNASKLAKKITVADAVEWSKSAWRFGFGFDGVEYDQKALECEDNLYCFDDLSDNSEEHLIENVVAQ
ncbi:hypothetical protein AVEN_89606-1, partial [Araneus ventricosus]